MKLKSTMNTYKVRSASIILFAILINLFLFLNTCFAQTALEKEIAFEGFSFKLKEVGSKITVSLDGKQGPLKTHSEIVPSPNRFLIDILGVPSNTARSIDLKGQIVERVRVGIHRDKTRIVIDLKKDLKNLENSSEDKSDPNLALYKYLFNLSAEAVEGNTLQNVEPTATPEVIEPKIEQKQKDIPISTPTVESKVESVTEVKPTLASKETLAPSIAPTTKVDLSPTSTKEPVDITEDFSTPEASTDKLEPVLPEIKTESNKKSPDTLAKSLKEVLPATPSKELASESEPAQIASSPEATKLQEKEKAVIDPSPIREIDQAILDIEKSNLIKKNVLKNVVFQTTSDKVQSTLAVSLSELGTYELKQISDSKYILELPFTRLRAKHLSLPQYPPDSFKGFIYIKAEETENSSLVIIVVDPGIKLTTEVSQGKLWIKSK